MHPQHTQYVLGGCGTSSPPTQDLWELKYHPALSSSLKNPCVCVKAGY